jgi:pilus assembly protein Flp/PilA
MSLENVKSELKRFMADESGISAVEYGLLAAGIALVVYAAAAGVGTGVSTIFGNVSGCLSDSSTC